MPTRAILHLDPHDEEAIALAEGGMTATYAYSRGMAAYQLSYLGKDAQRFLPTIQAMRKDRDLVPRVYATLAVWRITREKKEVIDYFRGVLTESGARSQALQVIHLLDEMGADAAELLPELRKLSQDRHTDLRTQAETCVRKIERAIARKKRDAKP
jgi:hypothetical protein